MSWLAYGASVQGTGHRRTGLPCQDAHGWRLPPGAALCAVADGLGSAARAQDGARRAVAAVLDALESALAQGPPAGDAAAIEASIRAAFQSARSALEAQCDGAPLRDYATTLLLAATTADWTAVGQIGDGAVVGRWPDGRLETLSLPQRGEYANETTPLTAADALSRVQVRVWLAPVQVLALLSDGLQGLCINLATGAPFEPFFAPFLQALVQPFDSAATAERLAAFLDSARVCARTDDDKTLLVAGLPQPARS
jgi:hypothetical protein